MLRRILSGLFTTLVVSVALLNLNGRLQDEPEPIDPFTFTAADPFAQMEDLIRQYLILGEVNQQNQTFLRVLPVFHLSGVTHTVTGSQSFSEITRGYLTEKHTTDCLLEFCCRLNI